MKGRKTPNFFIKFFCPIQKINTFILLCSSSVSSYPIPVSRDRRHLLENRLKMMRPSVIVSENTKSINLI